MGAVVAMEEQKKKAPTPSQATELSHDAPVMVNIRELAQKIIDATYATNSIAQSRVSDFAAMASLLDIKPKVFYSLAECAQITGVPYSTLYRAAKDGRLRTIVPEGSERGFRTRPDWLNNFIGGGLL